MVLVAMYLLIKEYLFVGTRYGVLVTEQVFVTGYAVRGTRVPASGDLRIVPSYACRCRRRVAKDAATRLL